MPLIKEWQIRPLQSIYAIVFPDAIHFKVKQDGQIVNKAAYVVIGIEPPVILTPRFKSAFYIKFAIPSAMFTRPLPKPRLRKSWISLKVSGEVNIPSLFVPGEITGQKSPPSLNTRRRLPQTA